MDNKEIELIGSKIYNFYQLNGWKNISIAECELKAIQYIDVRELLKN